MAPTKILWIDDDEEDIPIHVIGIRMQCELYKAAFSINRCLQLRLQWDENPVKTFQKKETLAFDRYVYTDEACEAQWQLIANRTRGTAPVGTTAVNAGLFQDMSTVQSPRYLLPEMKTMDGWLVVPDTAAKELPTWTQRLAQQADFQFVSVLGPGNAQQQLQAILFA